MDELLKEYEIAYNNKKLYLIQIKVDLKKNTITKSFDIYCYKNLISLLKFYDLKLPYISSRLKKI